MTVLTCLRIHQFAIIDEIEVSLHPGFNVLTGETGAGKSIIINALQMVLGGRGNMEVIRTGAEQAEVEALFDISDEAVVRDRLREQGYRLDEELVLRRVLPARGQSRAYVNGRLTTATQLRDLAVGLVDISSQHEHQTLTDPTHHLAWLDTYARLSQERQRLGSHFQALQDAAARMEELSQRHRNRSEREDMLSYQVREIDAVKPRFGEDQALEAEADRLRHAERLSQGTEEMASEIGEREGGIGPRLGRIAVRLHDLARLDLGLADLAQRMESARLDVEEAARDLAQYSRSVHSNPGRLAEIEERLHRLQRLRRKYGGTLESVVAHRESAAAELQGLEDLDGQLAAAETAYQKALAEAGTAARMLSDKRHGEARRLGEAIGAEIHSLGMGGARVHVDVAPLEGRGAGFLLDGARLSATGIDRVEFLIAPNPGEEPKPLRKVASGGELSRSLLALKRVLAGMGPVGTYVFDEVDAGVGGAIAEVIGRKLFEVSRHHQVVCITHLPQIAAFADHHLLIRKAVQEGRTTSLLLWLLESERLEEVARMLGGLEVSAQARDAAAEMIRAAHRAKRAHPPG